MKLRGIVRLRVVRDGKIVLERSGSNLVVATGKALVASIVGASGTKPSHIAFGTSSLAVGEAQTALGAEVGSRTAITTGVLDNEVTYSSSTTFGATFTLREAGLFNAAAAGTMLARWLFQEVTVNSGEEIDVTWTLAFGD